MAENKITAMRCEGAVQLGPLAMETISAAKDVEIREGAHGLWVRMKGKTYCIPYAKVQWWSVEEAGK